MKPFDPRLLQVVPALRRPLVTLALVAGAQGVAAIGLAFALARLVTEVVAQDDWLRSAGWVVAAFGVRAALGMLIERVGASTATTVSSVLRRRVLAQWIAEPVEGRPPAQEASTLAVQGAAAVEPYAARYLPALVAGAVVPVLAVGALVIVDPLSAAIVVVTLPLLPLFAALIGRTTQDDTMSRWRALEQLAGHFGDIMRGLPTLVAFGRAKRQVEVVRTVSEVHRTATMRTLRLAFLSSAALELLATISVAIVAVCVGLRLSHGSMTLHAGLLAILLAPEAYWPIRRVGAEFHAAADGATALDRLIAPPRQRSAATMARWGNKSRVDGSGISYTYPGASEPVIDDLDLRADRGLTVITGPSGVGKTTLLDLIAGLREPLDRHIDSGRIHYVTQRPFLPDGPLADVLRLGDGREATESDLWRVMTRVGLDTEVATRIDGLGSALGDDGFGLSAGQRTRLALARALLSTAPVLLLDEPTAHLDDAGVEVVAEVIRELAADRCVIAVTHDARLMAVADSSIELSPARQPVAAR